VVAGRRHRALIVDVRDAVAVLVVLRAAGAERVGVLAHRHRLALVLVVGDAVMVGVGDRDVPDAALRAWPLGGVGRLRVATKVEGQAGADRPGGPVVAGGLVRVDEVAVAQVGADAEARDVGQAELEAGAHVEPEAPDGGGRGRADRQVEEDAPPVVDERLVTRAEADQQRVLRPGQPPLVQREHGGEPVRDVQGPAQAGEEERPRRPRVLGEVGDGPPETDVQPDARPQRPVIVLLRLRRRARERGRRLSVGGGKKCDGA
jgi:hypothetical protein